MTCSYKGMTKEISVFVSESPKLVVFPTNQRFVFGQHNVFTIMTSPPSDNPEEDMPQISLSSNRVAKVDFRWVKTENNMDVYELDIQAQNSDGTANVTVGWNGLSSTAVCVVSNSVSIGWGKTYFHYDGDGGNVRDARGYWTYRDDCNGSVLVPVDEDSSKEVTEFKVYYELGDELESKFTILPEGEVKSSTSSEFLVDGKCDWVGYSSAAVASLTWGNDDGGYYLIVTRKALGYAELILMATNKQSENASSQQKFSFSFCFYRENYTLDFFRDANTRLDDAILTLRTNSGFQVWNLVDRDYILSGFQAVNGFRFGAVGNTKQDGLQLVDVSFSSRNSNYKVSARDYGYGLNSIVGSVGAVIGTGGYNIVCNAPYAGPSSLGSTLDGVEFLGVLKVKYRLPYIFTMMEHERSLLVNMEYYR